MSAEDEFDARPEGWALSRREALKLTLAAGVTATSVTLAVTGAANAASGVFLHGVASGDPLADRVVIWTRVTQPDPQATVPVSWKVARDPGMQDVVREGRTDAVAYRDHTVKIDVDGLEAGETYYYRFQGAGGASPVGRMKTLPPVGVKRLRLAVFSCANYELGYFNVYREAAKRDDLDAVLHLGDYLYEYGPGLTGYTTPATATGRVPKPRDNALEPREEIVALDQYRARHALYRSDPDLQAIHAKNAFINVWDDHEVANDAWKDGAENHQPETEGLWRKRRRAGVRAFYEWLPIREPADGDRFGGEAGRPDALYRSFDFGDLARLTMIDTREAARDKQLDATTQVGVYAGAPPQGPFPRDVVDGRPRTLMGEEQSAWFAETLGSTTQPWQIIGNQVLMFYQTAADINGSPVLSALDRAQFLGTLDALFGQGYGAQFAALGAAGLPSPLAADAWTGYPTARIEMLKALAGASNPIVLTGDSHNAWTANLALPSETGTVPVAAEFGGSSVSSPGFEQYLLDIDMTKVAALTVDSSERKSPADKLIYTDQARRGFMVVEVRPKATIVDHIFVSTVFKRGYTTERVRFRVPLGAKSAAQVASA